MRPNAAKAFIRGRLIAHLDRFERFFVSILLMKLCNLCNSVEGDGHVLSDFGARKESHAEGALLQVALRFIGLFLVAIAGQSDCPRSFSSVPSQINPNLLRPL